MFELISKYKPSGDQPQAIKKLVEGIKNKVKTLAGKLYSELRELFLNNHEKYFVSYYNC